MKRIIILADTHADIDPKLDKYLVDVDEIWHAGDIGSTAVLDYLQSKCTVLRAVYGNIDGKDVRLRSQAYLYFEVEGLNVLLFHYGGKVTHYDPRGLKLITQYLPDIFVCGHSHILRVMRDKEHNNMLFINPGAAGVHGFHKVKTLCRMQINTGKIEKLEVIELGERGRLEG